MRDELLKFVSGKLLKVKTGKQTKILALVIVKDREHLEELLKEKQYAFFLADASIKVMKEAINAVENGEEYISKSLSKQLLLCLTAEKTRSLKRLFGEKLTCREAEIAELIAHGLTSKLISGNLFISIDTVITHRKNIFRKLSINNAAALVKYIENKNKKNHK
jgi:DNA-binding NarL/FixJ family response regulator